MNSLLERLKAWQAAHTVLASALGLVGLAVYYLTQGDYVAAGKSLLVALGLAAATRAPAPPSQANPPAPPPGLPAAP